MNQATPDQQAVITRGDVWDFSQSVADAEKVFVHDRQARMS